MEWTRGDSIFDLVSIPAYDPAGKALPDQVLDVYAASGAAGPSAMLPPFMGRRLHVPDPIPR